MSRSPSPKSSQSRRVARSLSLLLALGVGCNRPGPLGTGGETGVEVRTAEGHLRLRVRHAGGGLRWIALALDAERPITAGPDGLYTTLDGRGREVSLRPSAGGFDLVGPDGRVRLEPLDGVLRLADARGVPLARVRREGEGALAFDPGGRLLVRAEPAGGRLVVSDREGKTLGLVTGGASAERAVLAFTPAVDDAGVALLFAAALERGAAVQVPAEARVPLGSQPR